VLAQHQQCCASFFGDRDVHVRRRVPPDFEMPKLGHGLAGATAHSATQPCHIITVHAACDRGGDIKCRRLDECMAAAGGGQRTGFGFRRLGEDRVDGRLRCGEGMECAAPRTTPALSSPGLLPPHAATCAITSYSAKIPETCIYLFYSQPLLFFRIFW
jgi:hypothetical protein